MHQMIYFPIEVKISVMISFENMFLLLLIGKSACMLPKIDSIKVVKSVPDSQGIIKVIFKTDGVEVAMFNCTECTNTENIADGYQLTASGLVEVTLKIEYEHAPINIDYKVYFGRNITKRTNRNKRFVMNRNNMSWINDEKDFFLKYVSNGNTYMTCVSPIYENGEFYEYSCLTLYLKFPIQNMWEVLNTPLTKQGSSITFGIKLKNDFVKSVQGFYVKIYRDKFKCEQISYIYDDTFRPKIDENCNQIRTEKLENLHSITLTYLTPLTNYKIDICGIYHKPTSFSSIKFRTKSGSRENSCFRDCVYNEYNNFLYSGIRKCNLCNTTEVIQYCDKNAPYQCKIQTCHDMVIDMPCLNVKSKTTYNSISISWKEIKLDRPISGYILLVYNDETCITGVTSSKDPYITTKKMSNFIDNCENKKYIHKQVKEYRFKNLNSNNNRYKTYIIPLVDEKKIGYVTASEHVLIYQPKCFDDCFSVDQVYEGIRSVTVGGSVCQRFDKKISGLKFARDFFCFYSREFPKPSCYINNISVNCKIPKCKTNNYGKFCVQNVTCSIILNSILITWQYPYKSIVVKGFVVMIHQYKCMKSYQIGESLKKQSFQNSLMQFIKPCTIKKELPKITFRVKFDELKYDTNYTIYLIPVMQDTNIGSIFKQLIKTEPDPTCLRECNKEGSIYRGIRNIDINKNPCSNWNQSPKLYAGTKANFCNQTKENGLMCYNHTQKEMVKCKIKECSESNKENCLIVDLKNVYPNKKEITISDYHLDLDFKNVIALVYDENFKCMIGVFYAKNQADKYPSSIPNCFYKKKQISKEQPISLENLNKNKAYRVYVYGTFLSGDTSNVRETKLTFVPNQCRSDTILFNEYSGIRSANENGRKCQEWSKSKINSHLEVGNLCTMKKSFDGKAWCIVDGKKSNCDIPLFGSDRYENYCPDLEITHLEKDYVEISIKTPKPDTYGNLFLLLDKDSSCVDAYINSKEKSEIFSITVRNLFISCPRPYKKSNDINSAKFVDLIPLHKYTVYVASIISLSTVSYFKLFAFSVGIGGDDCFADCVYHSKYEGIRAVSELEHICDRNTRKEYSNWCLYLDETKCKFKGHYEKCAIPNCKYVQTDVLCVNPIELVSTDSALSGKWSIPKKSIKPEGYIVLIYNETMYCLNAVIKKKWELQLDKEVRQLYKGCLEFKIENHIRTYYLFNNLKPNKYYTIYIIPIVNSKEVGFVRKLKQKTQGNGINMILMIASAFIFVLTCLCIFGGIRLKKMRDHQESAKSTIESIQSMMSDFYEREKMETLDRKTKFSIKLPPKRTAKSMYLADILGVNNAVKPTYGGRSILIDTKKDSNESLGERFGNSFTKMQREKSTKSKNTEEYDEMEIERRNQIKMKIYNDFKEKRNRSLQNMDLDTILNEDTFTPKFDPKTVKEARKQIIKSIKRNRKMEKQSKKNQSILGHMSEMFSSDEQDEQFENNHKKFMKKHKKYMKNQEHDIDPYNKYMPNYDISF